MQDQPENPYAAFEDDAEVQSELQDPVPSDSPPDKRGWSLFILLPAMLGILMLYILVSTIALLGAHMVVYGELRPLTEVGELLASRTGFLLIVVPGQIAILIPAIIAGIVSPIPLRERLGLVRGNWPITVWIAGAIATPLVGLLSAVVVSQMFEESEHLKQLSEAFRVHATGGFLAVTILVVAGVPAICEEMLFRGYIQSRLQRSLPAFVSILIASILFAAFHFDPIHVIAVFPIGVWLGILRFGSGSIYPAMIAHAFNNTLSVVSVIPEDAGAMDLPNQGLVIVLLLTGIPSLCLSLYATLYWRGGDEVQATGEALEPDDQPIEQLEG